MKEYKQELKRPLILIFIVLLGYWAVNNTDVIVGFLSNVFNILRPFILGGCFAFVLNIPMTFFENKLINIPKKRKSKKDDSTQRTKTKGKRMLAILLAIVVIVLILALLIDMVIPELGKVISMLIDNIPYYIEEVTKFAETNIDSIDIANIMDELNLDMNAIKDQLLNYLSNIVVSSVSLVGSIINGIVTFFIAVIFAIYLLVDKEKLQMQITKCLYAYLSSKKADKLVHIGKVSKDTFKNFLTVQCLEAIILGTLCALGMLLLKIPYAVTIGILVSVTALIPIVGAFIGCIVGAVLIVVIDPIKAVTFIVFFIILQQLEGNLIYPHVVGNKVGLPGIWVLVAITIGGDIGGIIGMLLGVPIATIIYILLRENVNRRLEAKEK